MRTLIPLIGALFLAVISVEDTSFEPEIPVAEDRDDGKTRVTDWMSKHSRMPAEILGQIYEEAHKHAFPDLLIAVAKVESEFDPDAVSDAGATGLMQVMAHVWGEELKQEGVIESDDDLFDISRSIAASAYILKKYLLMEGGDLRNALRRYVGSRIASEYPEKVIETAGKVYAMKLGEGGSVRATTILDEPMMSQ